jgi:hypothetical protein
VDRTQNGRVVHRASAGTSGRFVRRLREFKPFPMPLAASDGVVCARTRTSLRLGPYELGHSADSHPETQRGCGVLGDV